MVKKFKIDSIMTISNIIINSLITFKQKNLKLIGIKFIK